MAERYAVATGNWSSLATWNGGASLPGVGDTVHANVYTVTIDQDIEVTALSTRPGTTAVAGGGFTVSATGRTLRCNLYSGTTNCLTVTATTGTTSIYGKAYGSDTTASTYALRNTAAGLVSFFGPVFGDVGHGGVITSTGHLYVYGDSIGGVAYNCTALHITGSSSGNIYLYGTARSHGSGVGPGVLNASTGSACILIQAAEVGAGTGWPIGGKVYFNDLNNLTVGVRNAAGTIRTIGIKGSRGPFRTRRVFGGLP